MRPGTSGGRRVAALLVALGVAGVVALLVVVMATRPGVTNATAASPLLGKTAPAISGTSLSGSPVSLSSLRGRFVVVNFFSSWCVPCRLEAAELVQFSYDHKTAGDASVLGVVFEDSPSAALEFLRTSGAVWPAVPDPDGHLALEYGVRGPPESYLVAPDGRLVARVIGGVNAASLDQLISRARAEGA